jgi:peroxiredoxin
MTLKVGDKAPDFKLPNTEKKEISLSDYNDKNLIIHFFPAPYTGTCTKQLCTVRDGAGLYKNDKVDSVAISVDMPFSLAKFKEEQKLDFELLSDFNKEVCQKYGAFYDTWIAGLKGVAKRAVFVLDKDHKIVYSAVQDNAGDMPDFAKLNEIVAGLN